MSSRESCEAARSGTSARPRSRVGEGGGGTGIARRELAPCDHRQDDGRDRRGPASNPSLRKWAMRQVGGARHHFPIRP